MLSAVPTVVPGMQLVFNKCVRAGGQGRHLENQESRQGEREAAVKIPSTETDSCPYSPLPSILLLMVTAMVVVVVVEVMIKLVTNISSCPGAQPGPGEYPKDRPSDYKVSGARGRLQATGE